MDIKYIAHVFSFIILAVILNTIWTRRRYWNTQIRLYVALVVANLIMLVLDPTQGSLEGMISPSAYIFRQVLTTITFLLVPIASGYLWFFYVDYYIMKNFMKSSIQFWVLQIPIIIHVILALLSPFLGLYFRINELNEYSRGPLYSIMITVSYGYFVAAILVMIRNHHRIRQEDVLPMVVYPLPTLVAGIIEVLYGFPVTWPMMTVSLFQFFIHFMSTIINTDHLTRVANRFELDKYAEVLTKRPPLNRVIGGLMIDVNDFKKINDTHGHNVGDAALSLAASILRNSVRREDFVARYGGDEFVVLCPIKDSCHINIILNRIQNMVAEANLKKDYPFELSFSVGYGVYSPSDDGSVTKFIERLDRLMYEDKHHKEHEAHTLELSKA